MSDLSLEDRIKTLEQALSKTIILSEKMAEVFEEKIDEIHEDINALWRHTPELQGLSPRCTTFTDISIRELLESLYNLKREIQSPDE